MHKLPPHDLNLSNIASELAKERDEDEDEDEDEGKEEEEAKA